MRNLVPESWDVRMLDSDSLARDVTQMLVPRYVDDVTKLVSKYDSLHGVESDRCQGVLSLCILLSTESVPR
jgi:hypothetical protein